MTDSTAARPLPCGTWPSPITAADVAGQYRQVSFPVAIDGEVWWQELLPGEQGRTTVVHLGADGEPQAGAARPWSARTRCTSTGAGPICRCGWRGRAAAAGRSFSRTSPTSASTVADEPGPDGAGATPRPLTPAPQDEPGTVRRFVLPTSPCRRTERKSGACRSGTKPAKVTRAIVAVPLDGSAAGDGDGRSASLPPGPDFYAFPTPVPGRPPAGLDVLEPPADAVGRHRTAGGGHRGRRAGQGRAGQGRYRESVLAPVWHDETSLYVISDWPGWWNLYQAEPGRRPAEAIYPAEEEFAGPLWRLGAAPVRGAGRRPARGAARLRRDAAGRARPGDRGTDRPRHPLPGFRAPGCRRTACPSWRWPAARPPRCRVIRVDMHHREGEEALLGPRAACPRPGILPKPRRLEFDGKFGQEVHAWVYAAREPGGGRSRGRAPAVRGLGARRPGRRSGPTGLTWRRRTSPAGASAIIDVNYGGSTGYGRVYRERLRGQWGVVDVEDVIAAAQALVSSGDADPAPGWRSAAARPAAGPRWPR